ncbi:hypothetical protein [Streptomyces sp. NPDC059957]
MVHVVATCAAHQSLKEPEVLMRALQRADEARGWLEHARIHPSRGGAKVVLFLIGPDSRAARQYGRELFRRAVSNEPALDTWALAECDLLPVA